MASARASASLQGSGQSVMRALTPRAATPRAITPRPLGPSGGSLPAAQHRASSSRASARPSQHFKDMTIAEMESRLEQKFSKKMCGSGQGQRQGAPPLSARELLEENKQLIQEKKQQKALARKNSREFVQKLLEEDRRVEEGTKATDQGKKSALKELSQHYLLKIAEKEEAKAAAHRAARAGNDNVFFPFVEGETITKARGQKSARLREEMQGFLKEQREAFPPRKEYVAQDTRIPYPIQPKGVSPRAVARADQDEMDAFATASGTELKLVDEPSSHMARHPVFLIKAKEHMSRRLHDDHVRRALEEKVEQTKTELLALSQKRQGETQMQEDSMLVADALRYDGNNAKSDERRRHAQFLKKQIEEKKRREQDDRRSKQGESAGYWGPEEKPAQSTNTHRAHCSDLIKQMEVDQNRKLLDRSQKLRQEKKIIENCLVQMEQDREVERKKNSQHREVLVTTWKSQQKIKEAMKAIDTL
eukprot:gb/GFBE01019416.1/.p1 GENE.gb/GFBE01019416.1/~~gb/GFBE01019416.1/.p1  ORF type:complete len:476 (+),score=136.40 gb/GFBE01019416.1/:1-1428(+)